MEKLTEEELMEREDRCRKAMKTVTKAVFMRLFVTGLLLWILLRTGGNLWILGMLAFVVIINLSGLFPLVSEWRKRRRELTEILAQYE